MARAEAELRRRDHRRRRSWPGHRVLPGDAPRHHQRCGHRGRLHRLRQLRPQHHDHPRQLRHPRIDPLLQPQCRALPDPGRRDRLLDHAREQGPHLDGPHRDGHARRTLESAAQQRMRGRDAVGRSDGDQAALPADRPHRRRPLPRARRVVSRARVHRPPRSRRVGIRAGRDAARRARAAGNACHRAVTRRRAGRRREDRQGRYRRRHGDERRRRRRVDHGRSCRPSPTGAHAPAAGLRHQRLRAGPRTHRVVDGSALLRVANGARSDADRPRVRTRVELLASVLVPVLAVVLVEDGLPLAVRAQPQDPPPMDRSLRHLRRLLSDHGLHRRRRIRDHHRLGNVGIQGHSCRRRADGRADRDGPHPRPHRPVRALDDSLPTTRWPTKVQRGRARC